MGLLCALGGIIVTNVRVQGYARGFKVSRNDPTMWKNWYFTSNQHERLVHDGLDLFFVGLDANNTVLGEGVGSIGQETDRLEQVLDQDRLEDIKLQESVYMSE